jgi:amino acid adenylation domain-containing protein
MNLLTPFYEHAVTHPQDLALSVADSELTYQQLLELVGTAAAWIESNTRSRNPRIGILSSRSLTAYTGILAASYCGAAYVPLNIKAPQRYLHETLQAAQLDALIVDQAGIDILKQNQVGNLPAAILSPFDAPDSFSRGNFSGPEALSISAPIGQPKVCDLHDHAYLMFTSGTTGKPKGIIITVENVLHLLTTLQRRYQFTRQDRSSQVFDLAFDLSVFDIFMTLRAGASLHVVPDRQMVMPARFIQQRKLTVWFSVPSLIGMLKQMRILREGVFPSLRLSLFCGEALPEKSARAWEDAAPNSQVENLYGPTEATVACLLQDCADPHSTTPERDIIAIGWPFEGLHAAIVDPKSNFLPPGERGELAIHGPQLASGYLDNPQLTESRFPTLVHPEHGVTRWYLTGDLAFMDQEGRYHFLGRADNQVQLRGNRVELDEIEHHLREVSGCDNAVAIFLDYAELWAQEIVGVVLPGPLDSGTIRKQLTLRLPPYMVPKKIVVFETFPRTVSSKIDRNAIKRQLTSTTTARSGPSP